MYKSPVEIIYEEIQKEIQDDVTNNTMEVIKSYGIKVDPDELIKALNYDRHQYEKGYEDGYEDAVKASTELGFW